MTDTNYGTNDNEYAIFHGGNVDFELNITSDLSTLEHSIQSQNELNEYRDEINRLKAKIDYIEAKLLSLQYRNIRPLYIALFKNRFRHKFFIIRAIIDQTFCKMFV